MVVHVVYACWSAQWNNVVFLNFWCYLYKSPKSSGLVLIRVSQMLARNMYPNMWSDIYFVTAENLIHHWIFRRVQPFIRIFQHMVNLFYNTCEDIGRLWRIVIQTSQHNFFLEPSNSFSFLCKSSKNRTLSGNGNVVS